MTPSKLALGTAQLGMAYGIANVDGRPGQKMADEIVSAALEAGINCFDTAQGYGDSEAVLGTALKRLGVAKDVLIVTKLASMLEPGEDIRAAVRRACLDVGSDRLFGLLLHRQESLDMWESDWQQALDPLRAEGIIDNFGASVYDSAYFEQALNARGVDVIQAPFNLLDRRAATLDWFERAAAAGKLIFVRSIFLQGLLLRSADDLPAAMGFARGPLTEFRACCERAGLTPLEAGLGYVLATAKAAVVVFGAETPAQVSEIAALARGWEGREFPLDLFDGLDQPQGSSVIDPRLWPS